MKTVSAELIAHKQLPVRTLATLIRITATDNHVVALTDHDSPIAYDDGAGSVTYEPMEAAEQSNIQTTAKFDVDNGELQGALSATGFTASDILAGRYDNAEVRVLQVNYADLTQGHEWVGPGLYFLGEFSIQGLTYKFELRSLVQKAKQATTLKTSLTCRATFGDALCKVDAAALELTGIVTQVHPTEPRIIFTDTARTEAADHFVPGSVRFTSGANVGFSCEVKAFNGTTIELTHPAPFDIADADNYVIRVDCDKRFSTCRDTFDNIVNMRAEPLMPVAEGDALSTPGGTVTVKAGG